MSTGKIISRAIKRFGAEESQTEPQRLVTKNSHILQSCRRWHVTLNGQLSSVLGSESIVSCRNSHLTRTGNICIFLCSLHKGHLFRAHKFRLTCSLDKAYVFAVLKKLLKNSSFFQSFLALVLVGTYFWLQ